MENPQNKLKTVFIVDDNDTNLTAAKTALDGTYKAYALQSAARMFKMVHKIMPDLILLDVDMPEMDGFEAIKLLKVDERLKSIPVIFLTAKNDVAAEIQGFELGALDFINKPFSPPVLIKRIESHIETDKLIKAGQKIVRDIKNATIGVLADMVENRDKITGGHIERTQSYLEILLSELIRSGIYTDEAAGWDISMLLPSAQLHDVGKIAISDIILNKPGKLTAEEFDIIKTHCAEGERMISQIISKTNDDGFLTHAKRFAASHHEKWDGTGYPRGLSGEEIPLEGRLMAVADVYDALISERPYKKAMTHEQTTEIIKKDAGTHFDPAIVDIFLKSSDMFARISETA